MFAGIATMNSATLEDESAFYKVTTTSKYIVSFVYVIIFHMYLVYSLWDGLDPPQ